MNNLIERACKILYNVIKARAPIDTGNLVTHGIQMASDFSSVYIGNEAVDYAWFTNESWERGTNPNEGWIERAIEEALPLIKSACSGVMTDEDYNKVIESYEKVLATRLEARANEILKESI